MSLEKSVKSVLVAMLLCSFMVSCGETAKKEKSKSKDQEKIEVPATYTGSQEIQAYLHLKDALVLSDKTEASKNAKMLVASLDNKEGVEIPRIREYAMKIKSSANIEAQRKYFKPLSNAMAAYVAKHDVGIKLYIQHCPMAFDNAGGNWLSSEEKIFNPYFGDKMLHCGVVKEEI